MPRYLKERCGGAREQLKVNEARTRRAWLAGRPSVQHLSGHGVALTQWLELIEYQLHPDPHELHQLRKGRFVGLDGVGIVDIGMRDLCQIAEDFAQIAR